MFEKQVVYLFRKNEDPENVSVFVGGDAVLKFLIESCEAGNGTESFTVGMPDEEYDWWEQEHLNYPDEDERCRKFIKEQCIINIVKLQVEGVLEVWDGKFWIPEINPKKYQDL